MRFYVEAYDHEGKQILGNMDGQRSWEGKSYTRTQWFKDLPSTHTLNNRVAYWKIVNTNGYVLQQVWPSK